MNHILLYVKQHKMSWGHPDTLPKDTLEPTERMWAEFEYPVRWPNMEDAIKRGADTVTPRNGRTILDAAISKGYLDMTRMLIRNGCKPTSNDLGLCAPGDPGMLQVLLNSGIDFPKEPVEALIGYLDENWPERPACATLLRKYLRGPDSIADRRACHHCGQTHISVG